MATRDITLADFSVGSVDRLRPTIYKGTQPWDLSNGVVTISLKRPDKTIAATAEMIAENAANGVFYYDTTTTDLDVVGYWTVSILIEDNNTTPPTIKEYPYVIGFYVSDP